MSLPTLPSTLTVEISGQPLELVGKPNKEGTRIWFEASGLVPEQVADPTAALSAISVTFDGVALNAGEVHTSAPRKYSKTHAKAGQDIPGTGGNLTVTHSLSVELNDRDGKGYGFTLMVTVTYVDGKAIPQAESKTVVLTGISFASA
jgi:hypothetical protein